MSKLIIIPYIFNPLSLPTSLKSYEGQESFRRAKPVWTMKKIRRKIIKALSIDIFDIDPRAVGGLVLCPFLLVLSIFLYVTGGLLLQDFILWLGVSIFGFVFAVFLAHQNNR